MGLGMTDDQIVGFAYFGVILIALSATVTRLFRGRPSRLFLNLVMWFALFAAAIVAYGYRDEAQEIGNRAFALVVPGVPVPGPTPGSVAVAKSRDGHFHVRATVGGHVVPMIVDTGASSVVLSYQDAKALGVAPDDDAFTVATSTANGRASAAPVILADLTIGAISQKHVAALVAQPGALDISLLGNSFLEKLKSFSFEGDRLVLKR